jgi:hypothetical protein
LGRSQKSLVSFCWFLNERLDGLGLGHGGLDLAVLEEAGSEVAQHGPAVIRLDAQLLS